MEPGVLDSSAQLAVLQHEPGAALVQAIAIESVMSVVNVAEVQAKLILLGETADEAWYLATQGLGQVVDFDSIQARICGSLISQTKAAGLSAGDRSCLALAIATGLPVYTADRAWLRVNVGCRIELIR